MDDTDSQNSNDGHQGAPPQGDARQAHMDRERVAYLEQQMQYLVNQVQNLQALPPPHAMPPPNLNLPQPPLFSGTQSELPLFKLKLLHFLVGNQTTYHNSETQLLYAGSLLSGSAGQWYHSLLDPVTLLLPTTYDLPRFFAELEDFFGGGVTLQSRERSLQILRQTGSVSDLAIAFQNITNTFIPRWADHPLIYVFSQKLRETIRFEMTARGAIPLTFQTYIAAAISVEQNHAAAALSRNQPPPPPPRSLPPPPPRPPPFQPAPASSQPTPMDVDGTRGFRGSLTNEERRRRSDAGLCAYCGQLGHVLATCPSATRVRQARGTFQPPPGYHYPSGYPLPPPGFPSPTPFQGPYPGPWTSLSPPSLPAPPTHSANPPSSLPKNAPPSQ